MVFCTNEEVLPLKFSIEDFISKIDKHLPLLKFENVALSCEKLDWYSVNWFMKRTQSLVIQRVQIKPFLDMCQYEDLNINDNSIQELTLIMPQIDKLFEIPSEIEYTKIKLPSKVTLAGRITSCIDFFNFSGVKSIYLD